MYQTSTQDSSSRDCAVESPQLPTDSAGISDLPPSRLADDWQLCFKRSEMLRRFKTDLLGNLGHELRSPLSSQLGSLDLILSGLCDSMEEVQEFASSARQAAWNHLQMIADCIELSRYESSVRPLAIETISLNPLLCRVEKSIQPIARDRGIRLCWAKSEALVRADPYGLEQALLGLTMWSLTRLVHGELTLDVGETAVGISLTLTAAGRVHEEVGDRERVYWQVPLEVLEVMAGRVTVVEDLQQRLVLSCQLEGIPLLK